MSSFSSSWATNQASSGVTHLNFTTERCLAATGFGGARSSRFLCSQMSEARACHQNQTLAPVLARRTMSRNSQFSSKKQLFPKGTQISKMEYASKVCSCRGNEADFSVTF